MLWRKFFRDLKNQKGVYFAIASLIIVGIVLYVSLSLTIENLLVSRDNYYKEYNFADGFIQFNTAPKTVLSSLDKIEGIKEVEGRLLQDVSQYKLGKQDITIVRLLSFQSQQELNNFHLEKGKLPHSGKREILVSAKFLEGNNLELGDKLELIILGEVKDFTITGVVNSPEYVYEIPSGAVLTANPQSFGVAYISYDTMSKLFNSGGQINDIAFTLHDNTDFDSVKLQVEAKLKSYGLKEIYPRKDQISNSMLEQEITGLKGTAQTTPVVFLILAAAILYIMLKRLVEQQRGQVGILKAFGYTDSEIRTHYLFYGISIGLVGGLLGGVLGSLLTYPLAELYQVYFRIPGFTGMISFGYIFQATVLSILFCGFAAYRGTNFVLKLNPVEALRPPAPKSAKKTFVERIPFLWNRLKTKGRMAFRNIFRNFSRSLLIVVGIAIAFSMIIIGRGAFDAMDYLIDYQFEKMQTYDLKVQLKQPAAMDKLVYAASGIKGVEKTEPILEIPFTLQNKWYENDILVTGLQPDAQLYNLLNLQGEKVALPSGGLVLSEQLAKKLNIEEGSFVTLKPFWDEDVKKQVLVKKIIPQYIGLGAYMELDSLSKLVGSTPAATGILVKVESAKHAAVKETLQFAKNVAALDDKKSYMEQFEDLLASSRSTLYILIAFSLLTGYAIVFNITNISLAERQRELSTLLILGMTEEEVARIIFYEQLFLGTCGVLLGIPFAKGMLSAIAIQTSNDIYNMPVYIAPSSYLIALGGTIVFLLAAQYRITSRVKKFSILEALHGRD